jgi:S-adenosyl methyltransferase
MRVYARGNRQFLVRAVRFLCDAGIRQFLDIGVGLPTSPNVHEIAQQADPASRVVYTDNDPMVFLHAEALMAKGDRTIVVRADMRDTDDVLAQAGKLIDFRAPVALMFVACLHHLEDQDAILRMFNGRELVDPGLALVSRWRPDSDQLDPNAERVNAYGGIAAL